MAEQVHQHLDETGRPPRVGLELGERSQLAVDPATRLVLGLIALQPETVQEPAHERPPRVGLAVRGAHPLQDQRIGAGLGRRSDHLVHEPRLADPRLTGDGDQRATPADHDRPEIAQHPELGAAPDERHVGLPPLGHHRSIVGDRLPHAHGLLAASELDVVVDRETQRRRTQITRGVTHHDGARRRQLLEAGGGVDHVAHRREVGAGHRAHHHFAGVHTDSHPERVGRVPFPEVPERGLHRQRRPDGSVGIVLVGDGRTEQRHHRVSEQLVDHPTVGLDVGHEQGKRGVDQALHLFGIAILGERCEPDDVGEHDGHDSTCLVGTGLAGGRWRVEQCGATCRAEPRPGGRRFGAVGAGHLVAIVRVPVGLRTHGSGSTDPPAIDIVRTDDPDRSERSMVRPSTAVHHGRMSSVASVPPPPSALVAAAGAIDARKTYGEGDAAVHALDGVSVSFEPGRFTAIMGPSGSGKSTLLHCMAGLDSLTEGAVFIGDTYLADLSDKQLTELRRKQVGFIFQAYNLIPTLTAKENIMLPLTLGGDDGDATWIQRVIDTVGLSQRITHRPSELSGGQQQRVAVARALASRPTIIFADEPTGNLDSNSGADILRFMRNAVDEFGQTIVMVTHDPNAAAYADRAVFLADGKIVHDMADPTAERIIDRMKLIGHADQIGE